MLFNSFAFFLFFPLVTALYFLLPHRARWPLLLLASCAFYMYFIPKYILILGFTIVVDYFAGIMIEKQQGHRRKVFLVCSLVANIGVLALYKYFNFFNENMTHLAHALGWNYGISNLSLILPIGLSFHTFQAMSYTMEVYRGNQKPERHFGIYALYVMFYPQLVAGPIERPQNLLHQFHEKHYFDADRAASGLKLMAWGLFKKVVVADRLAEYVNRVYAAPSAFSGPVLLLATIYFAFQIYCDFSGYSDIAIGAARVMGFKLMRNFNAPYQAQSISEFWRRWHISLSTWFRDYLYFPMGGNRVSTLRWYFNICVVFVVSGLWHGASWTFIVWGALHSFYLVFGAATHKFRDRFNIAVGLAKLPQLHALIRIVITFGLVTFAWIFFRASSIHVVADICRGMLHGWSDVLHPALLSHTARGMDLGFKRIAVAGIILIEAVHLYQRRWDFSAWLARRPGWVRWSMYYGVVTAVFFLSVKEGDQFIYFQF